MRTRNYSPMKRIAAAVAAVAVLFGTAPAIADPETPVAEVTQDQAWTVTDDSGAVSEAEPAAPVPKATASEAATAPSPPVKSEQSIVKPMANTVTEPELAEGVTFKHKGTTPDGKEEYTLEAKLNLPADETTSLALPLDDISFMRTKGSLDIDKVEDVSIDGTKLDSDAVNLFTYPNNPSDDEKALIPGEVTGDVITLDTSAATLDAEAVVTATVFANDKASRDVEWELYRGELPELLDDVEVDGGAETTIDPKSDVPAGHSRLVVQVAGDRLLSGTNNASKVMFKPNRGDEYNLRQDPVYQFSPGEGAILQLYKPLNNNKFDYNAANRTNYEVGMGGARADGPMVPIDQPWAICKADQNGECVFDVPRSGLDAHDYYWVGMVKASPGYAIQDVLRTGASGDYSSERSWRMRYAHPTPYLEAGKTYYSGVQYSRPRGVNGNGADGGNDDTVAFMYERNTNGIDGFDYPTNANPWRSSVGAFQQVRDNPSLPSRCGSMRVALVLDTSGSMGKGMEASKNVLSSVVEGLKNTNTEIGLFAFNEESPGLWESDFFGRKKLIQNLSTPQKVNTSDGYNNLTNWIGYINQYASWGGTNWEQSLLRVAEYNEQNPTKKYDVVYVITDGNPTIWREGIDTKKRRANSWATSEMRDVEAAMAVANTVKSQGTRIVPVGIPADWPGDKAPSKDWKLEISDVNLRAISGPREMGNDSLRESDFAYFENGELLQQALINSILTCAISVERRFYDGNDAGAVPTPQNTWGTNPETKGRGWEFTADMTPERGAKEFKSQVPNLLGPSLNRSPGVPLERQENDKSEFVLNGETPYKEVVIKEPSNKIPEGWVRMDAIGGQRAQCRDAKGNPVPVEDVSGENGLTNDFKISNVPMEGGYHCIVYYRKTPTQTFKFKLNKVDAQNNNIGLKGAEFKLEGLDGGNNGEKKPATVPGAGTGEFNWTGLQPGRYTLTEEKPADDGYIMLSSPVFFRVANDGTNTKLFMLTGEKDQSGSEVTAADTNDIRTFPVVHFSQTGSGNDVQVIMKVANTKAGELPKTGGRGVFIQIMLGLLAMLAGALSARRRSRV